MRADHLVQLPDQRACMGWKADKGRPRVGLRQVPDRRLQVRANSPSLPMPSTALKASG